MLERLDDLNWSDTLHTQTTGEKGEVYFSSTLSLNTKDYIFIPMYCFLVRCLDFWGCGNLVKMPLKGSLIVSLLAEVQSRWLSAYLSGPTISLWPEEPASELAPEGEAMRATAVYQ